MLVRVLAGTRRRAKFRDTCDFVVGELWHQYDVVPASRAPALGRRRLTPMCDNVSTKGWSTGGLVGRKLDPVHVSHKERFELEGSRNSVDRKNMLGNILFWFLNFQ